MVATETSGANKQLVAMTATGAQETVQSHSPTALLGFLDKLGNDGWQLVNAESGPSGWVCWLKRPSRDTSGEVHVY